MKMRLLSLLGILLFSVAEAKFPEDFDSPLTTIAFGSCNRQDLPQPLWEVIAKNNPDLFIWLGDNVYADTEDVTRFQAVYDQQFDQPQYAAFRKETPIIGTWDDHDYGENNSGKWFPIKKDADRMALDFMQVPGDDPRRQRVGIYGDYTFGPLGKQVAVFLIDDRYFADRPGEDAELLGAAQWAWLEEALKASDAELKLIASGIQVLPLEQPFEKWANFPRERERLLDFIKEASISGVVFITGDRHIHEVMVKSDEQTRYPLIEVTSSGLTHSWRDFPGEPNRHRIGDVYRELGFGLISIDWEAEPATLSLEIRNQDNTPVNFLSLPLEALQPAK
ncbi:MAG: alkaline phosphatase D family protein [Verrucomicrobiota bacterium]